MSVERIGPEQADSLAGVAEPSENSALFGHRAIAAQLAQAHLSGKMHHGLLFTGPQGVGKATLAFHLAWRLLTWRDPQSAPADFRTPDPGSIVWRQIAGGAHPGLLHLTRPFDDKTKKFKTVITVDEVRRVGRFLSHTAHDGGWRVVIVDAADDMNTSAANALLKSLEEPPRATLFILISHSPGRLLPTIRSRCQSYRFEPLGRDDLVASMRASGADLPETGEGLDRLADLAEGSVRSALLLTLYGGLDIAEATDAVIDGAVFNAEAAARLAGALAPREAEIQFDIFNRHVTDRLARAAAQAGRSGDMEGASRLGELWEEAGRRIREAETYNLDKRQHVTGLLYRLNTALRR